MRNRNSLPVMNTCYSFVILSALIFFMLISGCKKNDYSTSPSGGTPGTNEIFIQGFSFASGTKTISKGTTIMWTNKDGATHTVTSGTPGSPSGAFSSGNIGPQGSFSHTFNQTGVFKYYCSIHTNMTATITVQ
ncbi:MAG TPA: plastocyanin/azurin family copper-binding protein [Ignavibacteriaceae bacterium]|jgi:plastocyanin|nr:plastocyanin/azurin family copper-binding protein [Ignavibacteriaceae bacterium]